MSSRIRVGVVGCGLIAQVMHLPHLRELADRYEVAAVCDIREPVARGCAERFGVAAFHTRWEDVLAEDLDAVLVLTSGDHAPIAISAAQTGLHVFVEKPMALAAADAQRMIDAAETAGVRLMVGTMKRYDPAYERLLELIDDIRASIRLARVTTLESPSAPYVAHYSLLDGARPPAAVSEEPRAAEEQALDTALGALDEETRWCYRWILLDSLVHELNALRGALGEPTQVVSAQLARDCVSINLRFEQTDCHLSWVDLPGMARYEQELAFYAPWHRLILKLPSPFLRNMPSLLLVEGGAAGSHSWRREEIVSYDEAFRRELVEFADCVLTDRQPRTSGIDGLADLRVCEAVAHAHASPDRHPESVGLADGGIEVGR